MFFSLLITVIWQERAFHKQDFLFQILVSQLHTNTQTPAYTKLPLKIEEPLLKLELHKPGHSLTEKAFTAHRQAIKIPLRQLFKLWKETVAWALFVPFTHTDSSADEMRERRTLLVCSTSRSSGLPAFYQATRSTSSRTSQHHQTGNVIRCGLGIFHTLAQENVVKNITAKGSKLLGR